MKPDRFRSSLALPFLLTLIVFTECARAHAGEKISGWFVKSASNYSGNLTCTYYVFFPNGHMYFGNPPAGSDKADYAKLYKTDPQNCGAYTLVGQNLTLNRNNGSAPETHTYTPAGGGMMDSCPLTPVWRFANGAKIEGKWGVDVAVVGHGYSVSSSHSFTFHRDGTFEDASHGGVDGRPSTSLTTAEGKGTYTFEDSKLVVKFNDGTTKTYDVSGSSDKAAPYILGIDGVGYGPMR